MLGRTMPEGLSMTHTCLLQDRLGGQPGSFSDPKHQRIGHSRIFIQHPSVIFLVKLLRTSMQWQNGASAPQSNVLGDLSRGYLMNRGLWQQQLAH